MEPEDIETIVPSYSVAPNFCAKKPQRNSNIQYDFIGIMIDYETIYNFCPQIKEARFVHAYSTPPSLWNLTQEAEARLRF